MKSLARRSNRIGAASLRGVAAVTLVVVLSACQTLAGEDSIQATSAVGQAVEEGTPSFAFASDRSGAGDIFVKVDGRLLNLTNHPAGDWDPAWSPDCANPSRICRIAFTSHRSGDSEIWTMDVQGRDLRNVTQHPAWDYWPAWSPDGQSIAFISERDGDQELFIQSVEGGEATQLTFNNESDRLPAWSPDGSRIAFAAVRNGVEVTSALSLPGRSRAPLPPGPPMDAASLLSVGTKRTPPEFTSSALSLKQFRCCGREAPGSAR
jgi:dipeptidyl aminopeptidase/acylaminoacyl peptidase